MCIPVPITPSVYQPHARKRDLSGEARRGNNTMLNSLQTKAGVILGVMAAGALASVFNFGEAKAIMGACSGLS